MRRNHLVLKLIVLLSILLLIIFQIDSLFLFNNENIVYETQPIIDYKLIVLDPVELVYSQNISADTTKRLMDNFFSSGIDYYSDSIKILVKPYDRYIVERHLEGSEHILQDFAKIIYRESRGESVEIRASIIWTILNRYDSGYASTIEKVYKARYQFAYVKRTPIVQEHYDIAKDVYTRWLLEGLGYTEVGRVLPKNYHFYAATNRKTYFRQEYNSIEHWDWSLESPYDA